nr:H-NS histone family protein [uncultured Noviherbaspirillum sp.]
MTSYKDIQAEIAELQAKAEEARFKEIASAISKIKTLMQEYNISVEDLAEKSKKEKGLKKKSVNVKFQDKDGNTWSGRGRIPKWLQGKDKEKFRI